MQNKLFVVIDKKNDVYVNSFVSLNKDIAKQQIINTLKEQIYVFQNTTNLAQKANMLSYLSTCQDYELHQIQDYNDDYKQKVLVIEYSEILKPYEKILKMTKEEVKDAIKTTKD